MPRSAENRSTISNHAGEMVTRPASTLARSSRSLTISVSSRGRGLDELDLLLLLVGQRAVEPVEQDPGDAADRAERRPELVAHVRQEPALQVGGLAQPVGVVVELGVQREDALVGLGQLGRQALRPAPRARRDLPARSVRQRSQPCRGARQRPADDHYSRVVAAAAEIAPQHAGDDRRMPLRQAGIGVERPAVADAVRVHHQQPARRPLVVERQHLPDLERRRCRSGWPGRGSARRRPARPRCCRRRRSARRRRSRATARAAPRVPVRARCARSIRAVRRRRTASRSNTAPARVAASAASGPWPRPSATMHRAVPVALGDPPGVAADLLVRRRDRDGAVLEAPGAGPDAGAGASRHRRDTTTVPAPAVECTSKSLDSRRTAPSPLPGVPAVE